MVEHMRAERRIVLRLFGPSARLVETVGTSKGPGTVEVRIGDRTVASGGTLREVLHRARDHTPLGEVK